MPETSQYMTTREVAALMRVKERKIYDLVAKGNIPVSKKTGTRPLPCGMHVCLQPIVPVSILATVGLTPWHKITLYSNM